MNPDRGALSGNSSINGTLESLLAFTASLSIFLRAASDLLTLPLSSPFFLLLHRELHGRFCSDLACLEAGKKPSSRTILSSRGRPSLSKRSERRPLA